MEGSVLTLLAIDPGTTRSGWVQLGKNNDVLDSGITVNDDLIDFVCECGMLGDELAIEMIASYGKPVGAETFETCVWIGRFMQAFGRPFATSLVFRRQVKRWVCNNDQAKDPHVRQALIDIFGPPGRKSDPGPTYGVTGDAWAALGVAATVRKLERSTTT